MVTVFTYPYLSAGAPALGEAKGLIIRIENKKFLSYILNINEIKSYEKNLK